MFHIRRGSRGGSALLFAAALAVVFACRGAAAADEPQRVFDSPDAAVQALVAAVRTGDAQALLAILGPAGKEIISSGDEVADRENGARFVQAYEEAGRLVGEDGRRAVLHLGKEDYPFPIPIVRQGEGWVLDTAAGREEILNRRIGRNELGTIQVCLAYVDAQREYARRGRGGEGLQEYAQKFISAQGKRDGLYWEAGAGEEESPMGPFAARAAREGYAMQGGRPVPYHGYYYAILKAQGGNAPGGEYDYVVRGRMIGGFALVAHPAEYGASGVKTFIVNHDGVVFEKDLGSETESLVRAMRKFDPDQSWSRVAP